MAGRDIAGRDMAGRDMAGRDGAPGPELSGSGALPRKALQPVAAARPGRRRDAAVRYLAVSLTEPVMVLVVSFSSLLGDTAQVIWWLPKFQEMLVGVYVRVP